MDRKSHAANRFHRQPNALAVTGNALGNDFEFEVEGLKKICKVFQDKKDLSLMNFFTEYNETKNHVHLRIHL